MEIPSYIRGLNPNLEDEILDIIIKTLPNPLEYEGDVYRVSLLRISWVGISPKKRHIPAREQGGKVAVFYKRLLEDGNYAWNAEDLVRI